MKKQTNKTWIAGIVLAISASLCCITPVLALISGVSGIAATFSWLEPARPFLIGITISVLGFAWFQKLKPRKRTDALCACDEDRQPSFIKSKTFLGLITISTLLLITFPNYAHIFYPNNKDADVSKVERVNLINVEFKIEGMTCQACAEHVTYEVNQLPGIIKSEASYESGNASIEFEIAKTSVKEIENAINSTGYHVTKIISNR